MLKSLLHLLLLWAREEHVPVRAGALAAAEADLVWPDIGTPSMLGNAVLSFLKAVEVPVLVLCGGCSWRRIAADRWLGHSIFVLVHFCCVESWSILFGRSC